MRHAEGKFSFFSLPPFTTSLASRCERLLGGGVEALVPFGQVLCLCLLLPTVGPPSPKRRKRSRNKRLSSPGPVVPQLLPWLLPTGSPIPKGHGAGR
ncbi:hypothetical protein IEQ34_024260 [Dendrobium chrysotoxum]|uniref:Secreted protein n=1 Tax=Dendrobium chrysotoxum TaxID=161865 RepID=A0AAV7FJG7_DENCH|nr:hypothetical protein IEQ34_024260 [Dendrobium chrysotoxum]